MVEVVVDATTLSKCRSGGIAGVVFLRTSSGEYPEAWWSDFLSSFSLGGFKVSPSSSLAASRTSQAALWTVRFHSQFASWPRARSKSRGARANIRKHLKSRMSALFWSLRRLLGQWLQRRVAAMAGVLAMFRFLSMRSRGLPPNPSLHPKCNSWLRQLSPSGELKR
jgi:hypothetical protein